MKRMIKCSEDDWPSADYWYEFDSDEEFEDAWDSYLAGPEGRVVDELKIFCEPSVQGGMGGMFIFDESGEDRFETVEVDFEDWCDNETEMAASSSNAAEYEAKFRKYVKDLCKI